MPELRQLPIGKLKLGHSRKDQAETQIES